MGPLTPSSSADHGHVAPALDQGLDACGRDGFISSGGAPWWSGSRAERLGSRRRRLRRGQRAVPGAANGYEEDPIVFDVGHV